MPAVYAKVDVAILSQKSAGQVNCLEIQTAFMFQSEAEFLLGKTSLFALKAFN